MLANADRDSAASGSNGSGHLSYKFQRLREQIRASVLGGEFEHRLPGERELGRRYNANAKTINKALSDLSSEGLLVRKVGRGTFVASGHSNGVCDRPQRSKACLLLGGGDGQMPYRRRVIEAVETRLADRQRWLRIVGGNGEGRPGVIALHEWPAAVRAATDGLLFYPLEPLSGEAAGLDDDIVAEAYRRHVPMVAMGGFGADCRISAIVPDYVDAGFRLAEYLMRIDMATVAMVGCLPRTRESELVFNGCRMAAARYRRTITALLPPSGNSFAGLWQNLAVEMADQRQDPQARPVRHLGLICVGRRSFMAVRACEEVSRLAVVGGAVVVGVLEPGDATAREAGYTAYEVDPEDIAAQAARLICDIRVGDKPVEISLGGSLQIREA